jgi:hypothetical protein
MKVIVLVILSLLVSCGPPIQYKDSILNYKGGVIISKTIHIEHYTFKIRMYNKKINRYEIKTIRVCDGDDYGVGETIK